jgi:hypothetical protein
VIIRRYSQAAAVVSRGIDRVPGLTAVVRISTPPRDCRPAVHRTRGRRCRRYAAGIEMAGYDAVTAAFAAIAETEHLRFIRDLIPYMLARPLLTD